MRSRLSLPLAFSALLLVAVPEADPVEAELAKVTSSVESSRAFRFAVVSDTQDDGSSGGGMGADRYLRSTAELRAELDQLELKQLPLRGDWADFLSGEWGTFGQRQCACCGRCKRRPQMTRGNHAANVLKKWAHVHAHVSSIISLIML